MRIAIYARYSSDQQSEASTEDQFRVCRQEIEKHPGWKVVARYADEEISGASMMRSDIQKLMLDASAGKFDMVVSEALDRISRDQADIATIRKRLLFANVGIYTLAEGEINEMHIGLKGTMNALFLKDLAQKTRRGLGGRIEKGKSGGGISYGYDVVHQFDSQGERLRGDRTINDPQAEIVRRIFREYVCGKSPKSIAAQLNREGVPAPSGGEWGQSTINGNRRRGTGVLNNDLYIGILVWNRQRFVKDPDTGKRVPRFNPESEWLRKDVSELRIVPQSLWDEAKARQKILDAKGENFHQKQRPRNLFSNLLKCGCCGGGFSKISEHHYGCSTARNKGTCDNFRTIRQDELEKAILDALQYHLMNEKACKIFCEEYRKHTNELRSRRNSTILLWQEEQTHCVREKARLIQCIKDGIPAAVIRDELIRVDARGEELRKLLENQKEAPVFIHPSMANRYKEEVTALRVALNDETHRGEAAELIRSLVDKVVLKPRIADKRLSIDLHGDLAGILSIASLKAGKAVQNGPALLVQDKLVAGARNPLDLLFPTNQQDKLVAGAGFEPATFGL